MSTSTTHFSTNEEALMRPGTGLGLGIVALCLLVGPWVGLLAAGLHTVMYLLLNAGINASNYPLFCCMDADSLLELLAQ